MRPVSPQTRFLLRGSLLLAGVLALWWFVLLDPLMTVLRLSVELTGGSGQVVTLTETGDWTFRFPFRGQLVDFDIPRADIVAFTFSLPVFWAVMLAAGELRASWRGWIAGTTAMAALETAMLRVMVWLVSQNVAERMSPGYQGEFARWIQHAGQYLILSVLPYAAPFLLAVAVHRGLRARILAGLPAAEPERKRARAVGGRSR